MHYIDTLKQVLSGTNAYEQTSEKEKSVIINHIFHNATRFVVSVNEPGRVAQSVGHLTRKSGVLGSIPGLATYFRFSFRFSRRAVVSYWQKYVHEVLVNRLGGLSLPRKSVVRLTDRPDMTLDVYRGRKTTMQQVLMNTKRDLNCTKNHIRLDLLLILAHARLPNYQNC